MSTAIIVNGYRDMKNLNIQEIRDQIEAIKKQVGLLASKEEMKLLENMLKAVQ